YYYTISRMSLGSFEQTADEADFNDWQLPSPQDVVACCNDLVSLHNLAELDSAPGWRGWYDGDSAYLVESSDDRSPCNITEQSLIISLASQADEVGRYQTNIFVNRYLQQPTETGAMRVDGTYHFVRETGQASWQIQETEYVKLLLDQKEPQFVLCGSQSYGTDRPTGLDRKEFKDLWSLVLDLRQALKSS
ncbi:MAG: hypothetical protein ACREGF_00250, partial [Candidatus Saccharimonadales bacterium]